MKRQLIWFLKTSFSVTVIFMMASYLTLDGVKGQERELDLTVLGPAIDLPETKASLDVFDGLKDQAFGAPKFTAKFVVPVHAGKGPLYLSAQTQVTWKLQARSGSGLFAVIDNKGRALARFSRHRPLLLHRKYSNTAGKAKRELFRVKELATGTVYKVRSKPFFVFSDNHAF